MEWHAQLLALLASGIPQCAALRGGARWLGLDEQRLYLLVVEIAPTTMQISVVTGTSCDYLLCVSDQVQEECPDEHGSILIFPIVNGEL